MKTHGNGIEIFGQARLSLSIRREQMFVNTRQIWWRHIFCVFTNICSLLIDKDGCAC